MAYEVLSKLGEGSFGKVFRAVNNNSGEEVALKVVRDRNTSELRDTIQEVFVGQSFVNHPNLVPIVRVFVPEIDDIGWMRPILSDWEISPRDISKLLVL